MSDYPCITFDPSEIDWEQIMAEPEPIEGPGFTNQIITISGRWDPNAKREIVFFVENEDGTVTRCRGDEIIHVDTGQVDIINVRKIAD